MPCYSFGLHEEYWILCQFSHALTFHCMQSTIDLLTSHCLTWANWLSIRLLFVLLVSLVIIFLDNCRQNVSRGGWQGSINSTTIKELQWLLIPDRIMKTYRILGIFNWCGFQGSIETLSLRLTLWLTTHILILARYHKEDDRDLSTQQQ